MLCWGSRRVFGSFTTRNLTWGIVKPSRVTSASKYLETGITSLLAANNWNNECASVKLPVDFFNKGKMFLLKHCSWIRVTIDPESSKDGIFWLRISMEMDGYCEIALFKMRCLVSEDTTLLVNVWSISWNWAARIDGGVGSTLTLPLHPWPWETGVFSLTCCGIVVAKLGIPPWLLAWGSFLAHILTVPTGFFWVYRAVHPSCELGFLAFIQKWFTFAIFLISVGLSCLCSLQGTCECHLQRSWT